MPVRRRRPARPMRWPMPEIRRTGARDRHTDNGGRACGLCRTGPGRRASGRHCKARDRGGARDPVRDRDRRAETTPSDVSDKLARIRSAVAKSEQGDMTESLANVAPPQMADDETVPSQTLEDSIAGLMAHESDHQDDTGPVEDLANDVVETPDAGMRMTTCPQWRRTILARRRPRCSHIPRSGGTLISMTSGCSTKTTTRSRKWRITRRSAACRRQICPRQIRRSPRTPASKRGSTTTHSRKRQPGRTIPQRNRQRIM